MTYIDATYIVPTGVTRPVSAGGDLQAALDAAQPGDVIVLQAGATFTGNFTLPNKNGSTWIYVQGSAYTNLPPPGTRVGPSDASLMPKIVSPNSAPAISTTDGAHHFRFVGIEVAVAPSVPTIYNIMAFGGSQTTAAQVPHDFIVDRCYVHGQTTGDVQRTILLNSAMTGVIDSYLSNAHAVGYDSQALGGWNGPGPFKIVNNYLEGAGENVMFGGADPLITGLVPSDIEIRRNTLFKPLTWKVGDPAYAGTRWTVKNLFELKNAQRVLVDGNVMTHNWIDAQAGFGILLTPRNQSGTAPWSVVQDVTFTNNVIRDSYSGVNMGGFDDAHPSQQLQRVLIRNNVFYGLDGSGGIMLQNVADTESVTIDHNTGLPGYGVLFLDGVPSTNFVFTNNLIGYGLHGVAGTGQGEGTLPITVYLTTPIITANVLAGPSTVGQSYPVGIWLLPSLDNVGFVDWEGGDYRLALSSPYKNAGTDGKDLGADFDALAAALGVGSSLPPPTNLTVRQ